MKPLPIAFLMFLLAPLVPAHDTVVYPRVASVASATKKPFTAYVNRGVGSQAVGWYVNGIPGGNEKVGTISRSGIYSAPAAGGFPVTIQAISTNGFATATVTLNGELP